MRYIERAAAFKEVQISFSLLLLNISSVICVLYHTVPGREARCLGTEGASPRYGVT